MSLGNKLKLFENENKTLREKISEYISSEEKLNNEVSRLTYLNDNLREERDNVRIE